MKKSSNGSGFGFEGSRKLQIDTLEERLMLTVSPASATDVLVNQPTTASVILDYPTYITTPVSGNNQATATNNVGDYVTVWQQDEPAWLRDADGNHLLDDAGNYRPYIDPITKLPVMESNVYGRYFTDEVQRITLPDEIVDTKTNESGRFTLRYGGNEIQKLTFSTSQAPQYSQYSEADLPIVGTFQIGGIKAHGENQTEDWVTVQFNEQYGAHYCAKMIQQQLEGLGPYMQGVKVTATTSREYFIEFDNAYWMDKDVPELQVRNLLFHQGFMAGVMVTTDSQPFVVSSFYNDPITGEAIPEGIQLVPNDPKQTAENIYLAFQISAQQYYQQEIYGPINTNIHNSSEHLDGFAVSEPPIGEHQYPEVFVSVVDEKTFDITFVGNSGKTNIPEMMVSSATDAYGNEYVDQDSLYLYGSYRYIGDDYAGFSPVRTIKESSDAFRVNPPEPDNPITPGPDVTGQYKPVVALDADGDFVIAWETEVKDYVHNPYNLYDIYAQRFTTQAVLPEEEIDFYSDGKAVQGVRKVGAAFKVNDYDNGVQADPTISCDAQGNFVIGWVSYAQDSSYFVAARARWYDRDGNPLTLDVEVSQDYAINIAMPTVAMSDEGYTVFAWMENTERDDSIWKAVYEPNNYNTPIVPRTLVENDAGEPSIAFDSNNRYYIAYTTGWEWKYSVNPPVPDLIPGMDVYMQGFEIHNTEEVVEIQTRESTRINSYEHWFNYTWHSQQMSPSVSVDADGDLLVGYQGFFPDASYTSIMIPWGDITVAKDKTVNFFSRYINQNKNPDLVPLFQSFASSHGGYILTGTDVDDAIRTFLVYAEQMLATHDQLSRTAVILEEVGKYLRGGSSEVGYTRLDADVVSGETPGGDTESSYTTSDAIANAQRDGVNSRWYIALPLYTNGGTANMILWREDSRTYADFEGTVDFSSNFSFSVVSNNGILNIAATRDSMYNAINGTDVAARFYPQMNPTALGSSVVINTASGEALRSYYMGSSWYADEGTFWDNYIYFEITFVGGAHDTSMLLGYQNDPGTIDNVPGPSRMNYFVELYGSPGTSQLAVSTTMSKAGSYAMTWSQDITYVYQTQAPSYTYAGSLNQSMQPYVHFNGFMGRTREHLDSNIFTRFFVEDTDTAGPVITDYLLPSGKHLDASTDVTQALKNLVVVFDEQMRDVFLDLEHGVDNTKNWALYKDGELIKDGIESIVFGLNASQELAKNSALEEVNQGSLTRGTSKWEAVITFNGDLLTDEIIGGALGNGQYTLVAKSTLMDIAGNRLGKNGYGNNKNGREISLTFNVNVMDGYIGFDEDPVDDSEINFEEHIVNDNPGYSDGMQYLREDAEQYFSSIDVDMESSARSVVSDAEGNYAIVWVSEDPLNPGVFVKKFRSWSTYNNNNETKINASHSLEPFEKIFRLTDSTTATHATLAMDADGDLIVVWTDYAVVDGVQSRDVFFDYLIEADGELKSVLESPRRANTETEYDQQHPSVDVSVDGDFVIVWESDRQDGSGWGVYGQRFAPDCTPIGGLNAVQDIYISGQPTGGTFRLQYSEFIDEVLYIWETKEISIHQNTFQMIEEIEAAFKNMEGYIYGSGQKIPNKTLHVEVSIVSMNRVSIEFIDADGNKDVPELTVIDVSFASSKKGQEISVGTSVKGGTGEFQVNTTTEYDQRFPSIAMAQNGEFVVTWTGWKLDRGTYTFDSDIYARKFVSSASQRLTGTQTANNLTGPGNKSDETNPLLMFNDDPANHTVAVGTGFDGVVRVDDLSVGGMGSGTLLTSGMHVLTAGHVVCDDFGNPSDISDLFVTFETPTGTVQIGVSEVYVHPTYTGTIIGWTQTADIAILRLASPAPSNVERYDIYRDRDELGKVATLVGYGLAGTPATGGSIPSGTKHYGQNIFEILGTTMDPTYHSEILMYDHDDGTIANDLFGNRFGIRQTGLGLQESAALPGDSGGPAFIDGKVAGLCSFGAGYWDANGVFQKPVGTAEAYVRVSGFSDWIDSILSGGGAEYIVNASTAGDQLWSDVAIDAAGNFVVSWTDFAPPSSGQITPVAKVMARRFTATSDVIPGVIGEEFLVSSIGAANSSDMHNAFSKIAMTPTGDFVITWEGLSDAYLPADGNLDFDIFARKYVNTRSALTMSADNQVLGYGRVGDYGELSSVYYVNREYIGDQRASSVAVSSTGDIVFVWQGPHILEDADGTQYIPDDHNLDIFYRFIPVFEDISAPFVTDVNAYFENGLPESDKKVAQILDGSTFEIGPNQLVVTFSEEMFSKNIVDSRSILNKSNWILYRDGYNVSSSIVDIYISPGDASDVLSKGRQSAMDAGIIDYVSRKIEIVITLDDDPSTRGVYEALSDGKYTLTLRGNVEDLNGNALDGVYDGLSGGNFQRTFYVGDDSFIYLDDEYGATDEEDPYSPAQDPLAFGYEDQTISTAQPAIAMREDGAFVIVGVAQGLNVDPEADEEDVIRDGDIVVRHFDRDGNPVGTARVVNTYTEGEQHSPDVSMDSFGNYIVVWSGEGLTSGPNGIYARVYDAFGNPTSYPFQLSQFDIYQGTPKVAINDDGTFLVTWLGRGKNPNETIVYARAYTISGEPIGNMFELATNMTTNCRDLNISCDREGNYVATWSAYDDATKSLEIFATTFNINTRTGQLSQSSPKFRVNTNVIGNQVSPKVEMNNRGEFVISWQGSHVNLSDSSGYGIYARAFTLAGKSIPILGSGNDVLINETVKNDQNTADVALSHDGTSLVFTWSSFDQELFNYDHATKTTLRDYGVYARVFKRDVNSSKGFADPTEDQYPAGEFQVNRVMNGNQYQSVVAMDGDGDFSIAWVGPYVYDPSYLTEDEEAPDEEELATRRDWTNVFVRSYRPNGITNPLKSGTSSASGYYANSVVESKTGLHDFQADYIRPGGGGYELGANLRESVSSNYTYVITGTAGNDVLEISPGSSSGSWLVKLNGKTQSIPKTASEIVFNGLGGTDSVKFTGTSGKEQVSADASKGSVILIGSGLYLRADGIGTLDLDGAGGKDTLDVNTSTGNDSLEISVGELVLGGVGLNYRAKNFELVNVVSQGGKDVAVMRDSKGDDRLEMRPGTAIMEGDGYKNALYGFSKVDAISSYGNDTASLHGSTYGADTLTANEYEAIMRDGTSYWNRAKGFQSVEASGYGQNNSVVLSGSESGGDYYTVENGVSTMRFAEGNTLSFSGIQLGSINVARNSKALLSGGTGFLGYDDYSQFAASGFQQTLTGFSSTTVQATSGTGAKALLSVGAKVNATVRSQGRTAVLNSNGVDLYHLIAFDQVVARKEAGGSIGKVLSTTDYLLATGNWEE